MGWGKKFFFVEYPLSPAQYCATKLLVLAVATHPTLHTPETLIYECIPLQQHDTKIINYPNTDHTAIQN